MSNKTILIIEDDSDVRLGYQILFKAHHYDTVHVQDGATALTAVRRHQPDLIILDLGLPGGDGFVVLDRLRNNNDFASIPVVVVSARDPHRNRDRALKAGACAYLQKPWNDRELLGNIRDHLYETGAQESPISP